MRLHAKKKQKNKGLRGQKKRSYSTSRDVTTGMGEGGVEGPAGFRK